jgi:HK97 gp10 family phage protein
MSRVSNWTPQKYDGEFMAAGLDRLERAAAVVADKARQKAPTGTVTRRGGKYWMEREPGSLKKSVRVVRKKDSNIRNVRVYAGNTKVFYARMVEFGTVKTRAQSFLRPALNSSKSEIQAILKGGA